MAASTSFAKPAAGGGWVSARQGDGPKRVWGMGFTVRNRKTFKRDSNPETTQAKIDIRRNIVQHFASTKALASVLDLYAGEGAMHDAVWSSCSSYTGIDLKWYADSRRMYVGDNKRIIRAISLEPFTIFDLDAYGEPWTAATIIAARRKAAPGERIAFSITDGSGMPARLNKHPTSLLALAGLSVAAGVPALKGHRDMVDRALVAIGRRMGMRLEKLWMAESSTGARCLYVGASFVSATTV